jgi:predicted RNase H-like HicB family nuclease
MASNYREIAGRCLVLIEGGPESNFSAWSPDLPGCVAVGDSLDAVEREMHGALAFHLQGLEEEGDLLPDPNGPGVYLALGVVTAGG